MLSGVANLGAISEQETHRERHSLGTRKAAEYQGNINGMAQSHGVTVQLPPDRIGKAACDSQVVSKHCSRTQIVDRGT